MPYLFWKDLLSRRGAVLVAAVLVAAAVAVLVVQRSLAAAVEDQVHDLAHRLGRNMLVVPEGADLEALYQGRPSGAGLADDLPDRIRSSPSGAHVQRIEASLYAPTTVDGLPLTLVGRRTWQGGPPSGPVGRDGVLLGRRAAVRLGLRPGDVLNLSGRDLPVRGVLGEAPDGMDDAVFADLGVAQAVAGRPGRVDALRLGGCWCRIDVNTLAGDIQRLLPGTRAITVAGVLSAQKGTVAAAKRYGRLVRLAALGLVAVVIALFAGGQVRRHRRGIGLLVAVGATPGALAALFTAEALAVGLVGVAGGAALGAPLTRLLGAALLDLPSAAAAAPPLQTLLLVVLVAGTSALTAALGVTRLDPTVALREV